jgi:hypothetical protein
MIGAGPRPFSDCPLHLFPCPKFDFIDFDNLVAGTTALSDDTLQLIDLHGH